MLRKKIKIFVIVFLSILIIPMSCLTITGCETENNISVVSMELESSNGLVDTYAITFSDGSIHHFQARNGTNGRDLTVQDLYNEYKNIYGDDLTYKEFLDLFLTSKTGASNISNNIAPCLLSSAIVYAEFYETSTKFRFETKVTQGSSGSAVIWKIDDDYTYLVTNSHVVYYGPANEDNGGKLARKIHICLYGSEASVQKSETEVDENGYPLYIFGKNAIECELVGVSFANDIAVIKAQTARIKEVNNQARAVKLAENYYVGDNAIAIGNAEGLGLSVTKGIVSVDSEEITLSIDKTRSIRELRIDSALYHGNSGGGLFNENGELIGVNNAGNEEDQNINYALPIDSVKSTVENIMYFCNNENVYGKKIVLGVTVGIDNSKYVLNTMTSKGQIIEDVIVKEVIEGSKSEQIGLMKDDKIVSFIINGNEKVINRMFNIGDLIKTLRAGDQISFNVVRVVDGINKNISTSGYIIKEEDLVTLE